MLQKRTLGHFLVTLTPRRRNQIIWLRLLGCQLPNPSHPPRPPGSGGGGGGRGEKIRTYNFKDSRVTDHRIGFTLHQLQEVLAGNLDPVIDALTLEYQTEQLAYAGEK